MNNRFNRKSEVWELQHMLRVISQADDRIPLINPDGIFGEKTEAAVIAFQKNENMIPNGIVDFATWDAIFHAYTDVSRVVSPRAIRPFPSGDYRISRGERSDTVLLIQIMLSSLALALDIFDDIAPTGIYDQKTEDAILAFQALRGLPPDGVIDRNTWNALAQSYQHVIENELYSD